MPEFLLNAFITLIVVIDPVGVAAGFVAMTAAYPPRERRVTALRGVALAGVILLFFALVGNAFLGALGIGLPAFRIAGGILLFVLALEMILVRQSGVGVTPSEQAEAGQREDISVFPLAVPLIAGPGAITSTVLLMGQAARGSGLGAAVLAMIALTLGLTLLALLAAATLMRLLGVTGTNVVGRVLGILLAALAVQFVLDGLAGAGIMR